MNLIAWLSQLNLIWSSTPPWRQGQQSWMLVAVLGVLLSVAAMLAGASWLHDRQEVQKLDIRLLAHQVDEVKAPTSAQNVSVDFTQSLPTYIDPQAVVSQLQRSCNDLGVELASIQLESRPASPQALGKTEFNMSLRGAYTPVKTILAEVLARFPGATLRRLSARSSAQSVSALPIEEWSVGIALWNRPATAAPASPTSPEVH